MPLKFVDRFTFAGATFHMRYFHLKLVFLVIGFLACGGSRRSTASRDDQRLEFTIVQVNDVYEIAPVSGGQEGGMARVATISNLLKAKNKNTFLVMAGDFLSPSVYNSLRYQDKRIRGRQMVEAMNAARFDFAVFGNHEFDIYDWELQERIDESRFQWISSNSFQKTRDSVRPFRRIDSSHAQNIPQTFLLHLTDEDGTQVTIGLLGINIDSNPASYVEYTDPLTTAKQLYTRIKDSCDAVIAITHQTIASDKILAQQIPAIPLIVGGHEHDMRFEKQGNTFITKAHSNARSAYRISIAIDKQKKLVTVRPSLVMLDSTVAQDSATSRVVIKWSKIAADNYASIGFDPSKIVIARGDSLEGREVYTRVGPTNLTKIMVEAMKAAAPDADVVINNAGSIRLDDVLYPPISQYDILRTLPFGGSIREVEMKGALLMRVLRAGELNKGSGGYLHHSGLPAHFDTAKVYRVAMSDFLLSGAEANLRFLNVDNPQIVKVYAEAKGVEDPRSDIRLAIVRLLGMRKQAH